MSCLYSSEQVVAWSQPYQAKLHQASPHPPGPHPPSPHPVLRALRLASQVRLTETMSTG